MTTPTSTENSLVLVIFEDDFGTVNIIQVFAFVDIETLSPMRGVELEIEELFIVKTPMSRGRRLL